MTFIESNTIFARVMKKMMDAIDLDTESFMSASYKFFAFNMLEGLPLKTVAGAEMKVWGKTKNKNKSDFLNLNF